MNQELIPEAAFEKWWKSYALDPEEGYEGYEKEDHMRQAFLAGIQHQEMNQINCLYEIRKAVGDPEGKLMQDELVGKVRRLVSVASVSIGNPAVCKSDDAMLIGESDMTEKEEA
jgi:hypothetical protein